MLEYLFIRSTPLTILDQVDGATETYGQLFQQSGDLILDTGTNPDMLQEFELKFKSTTTISAQRCNWGCSDATRCTARTTDRVAVDI